jgi:hypothetical protein
MTSEAWGVQTTAANSASVLDGMRHLPQCNGIRENRLQSS